MAGRLTIAVDRLKPSSIIPALHGPGRAIEGDGSKSFGLFRASRKQHWSSGKRTSSCRQGRRAPAACFLSFSNRARARCELRKSSGWLSRRRSWPRPAARWDRPAGRGIARARRAPRRPRRLCPRPARRRRTRKITRTRPIRRPARGLPILIRMLSLRVPTLHRRMRLLHRRIRLRRVRCLRHRPRRPVLRLRPREPMRPIQDHRPVMAHPSQPHRKWDRITKTSVNRRPPAFTRLLRRVAPSIRRPVHRASRPQVRPRQTTLPPRPLLPVPRPLRIATRIGIRARRTHKLTTDTLPATRPPVRRTPRTPTVTSPARLRTTRVRPATRLRAWLPISRPPNPM